MCENAYIQFVGESQEEATIFDIFTLILHIFCCTSDAKAKKKKMFDYCKYTKKACAVFVESVLHLLHHAPMLLSLIYEFLSSNY